MNQKLLVKIKTPILVTGACGFIGANFVNELVKNKIPVNIIIKKKSDKWRILDSINDIKTFYCDLKNKAKLSETIKKIKPKSIYHFAAHGAYSFQNTEKNIRENTLLASVNLLNECKKYNFKLFINLGSSSEYGFKDKKMSEYSLLEPNSFYSIYKSCVTHFMTFEAKKNNLNIITVRPFHVYGPYEDKNRLFPSLFKKMTKGQSPKLVDKKISRDLIYIKDFINMLIILSVKKNITHKIINFGSGKNVNIENIFRTFCKILSKKIKPKWNTMKNRHWDQKNWLADTSLSKKILNYKVNYSLEDGIRDYYNWYKKNKKFYD